MSRFATPWSPGDAVRLLLVNLVALAGLGVAWHEASSKVVVGDQFPWLNIAMVAVILSGVANGTWFLIGRMALRKRRQRLLPALLADETVPYFGAPLDPVEPVWVAATGTSRYHRAECLMVAGKAAEPASRVAHEQAGRRPCGVCVGD